MSRSAIALGSVALCLLFLSATASDNSSSPVTENAVLPTAPAPTKWEQKIKRVLENKTSVDVADQPLSEWVTFLSDKFHIPILFDKAALTDATIDASTTPVDMVIKDVSVLAALKSVLGQHNLTFVLTDEVLLITTTDKANARFFVCTYDVHDLVANPNQGPKIQETYPAAFCGHHWHDRNANLEFLRRTRHDSTICE